MTDPLAYITVDPQVEEAAAIADLNVANGWAPNQYRIRAENKGLVLEQNKCGLDGNPSWTRVFYSRDKHEIEKALARRLGKIRLDLTSGCRKEVIVK